ncbi:hypothetical protein AN1V17_18920 [Vallitalea sediminicola]
MLDMDLNVNVYALFDKVYHNIFKIKKRTRGSIRGFTQEQLSDLARFCEVIPFVGAITQFDYKELDTFRDGIGDFLKLLFSYGTSSCIFYTFVDDISDEYVQLIAKNYTYKLLSYEKKVVTIKFLYEELHNREFDLACYYECLGDICVFYNHKQSNHYYDIALSYYDQLSLEENDMLVAGNKQEEHYAYVLHHAWSLYYNEEVPFYSTYRFEGANRIKDKISRLSNHR